MKPDQHLRSGDQSQSVQAGNDATINNNYGLGYNEVKEVALDVFTQNFLQLRDAAANVARERAEEITEDFLRKLQAKYPDAIKHAQDPDMQRALYQVQSAYALSGDKQLGDILVDILVDRSAQTGRALRQVVLNEALTTAPRLTAAGLSILTTTWFLSAVSSEQGTVEGLYIWLRSNIVPFVSDLTVSGAEFRHLEYAGCVSVSALQTDLIDIIRQTYQGLFNRGVGEETLGVDELRSTGALIPCLRNPELWQVDVLNERGLDDLVRRHHLEAHSERIKIIFNTNCMDNSEVEKDLVSVVPEMAQIIDVWRSSLMKHCDLTSVGTAIAHANWRRVTGGNANLDIWLH